MGRRCVNCGDPSFAVDELSGSRGTEEGRGVSSLVENNDARWKTGLSDRRISRRRIYSKIRGLEGSRAMV
jgi:hypothetical protein